MPLPVSPHISGRSTPIEPQKNRALARANARCSRMSVLVSACSIIRIPAIALRPSQPVRASMVSPVSMRPAAALRTVTSMTDGAWEIVGRKDQELPLGTTLGNALRELITKRFKHNAAKNIETRWDLDPKTAKNVVQKGHVSERTLTKAALAEKWDLWMALGEELFGQSYHEWEEQRLQRIIDEAERDREKVRRLRSLGTLADERALRVAADRIWEDAKGRRSG